MIRHLLTPETPLATRRALEKMSASLEEIRAYTEQKKPGSPGEAEHMLNLVRLLAQETLLEIAEPKTA